MRVVQAPEVYEKRSTEIACFLAGGCGNTEWQERVINELNKYVLNSLVIYNPYNPNIDNKFRQIEWEFNYLNNYINDHFIFSCYFDKYTRQPMSMYELGRASVLCQNKSVKICLSDDPADRYNVFYTQWGFPMIVSLHEESPCKEDLIAQCGLAHVAVNVRTPEEHAKEILFWYKDIKRQMI